MISDESLTNKECPNRYRLYKALNPETGDECWLFYSDYDTYDGIKHRVYGVSYVFKDRKTMPKNFKKLTKDIEENDFKYIQWKNRLIICGNIGGIASLKTGKYKVPSSGGKSPYDTMPIRVIIVNN